MTGPDPDQAMRDAVRELLRELMPGVLGEAPARGRVNGHANGDAPDRSSPPRDDAAVVPEVPTPPVAAVLRPSTWSSPPAPGEVIGDLPPQQASEPRSAGSASDARVEPVTIDTDEDLEKFVRALLARVQNPRDRLALRDGRLRFTLRRSATTPVVAGTRPQGAQVAAPRVLKGAVTERSVRAAATDGARLVLAPGAVLTPLARDRAKALGVQIERERRC